MWHANLELILAWLSPILLGFVVAFVLSRNNDKEPGSSPARHEHHDAGSDRLHRA